MLDKELTKIGRITITENEIELDGFEADGMCREVAILACLWGSEQLLTDARKTIAAPGSGKSGIGSECGWELEDEGFGASEWSTECGSYWRFTEGGPSESGMKFCFKCGKPIELLD